MRRVSPSGLGPARSMTRVSDQSEIERLLELVGPSEASYEALRADRDEAQRVARAAVFEAGELRGRIVELGTQLSRARQDQDLLQRRIEMSSTERVLDRIAQRWAKSVVPRLKRGR